MPAILKKLLKWAGIIAAMLILSISSLLFSMRFHDGPLEILSGGPFESGELSPAPTDWSFLQDRATIEFQTMEPTTSRTVWLGVFEGRLFLVSGYMNTGYGAIWKQWPHYLADDDRVILRIDDKLYEQRLERVMQGPEVEGVLREFSRKYGTGGAITAATVTDGDTWMFEVLNR